jgi:tRNA-specific 2-thiouridylase
VTNTVTVGTREELDVTALSGVHPRWCGPAPVGPVACAAQLRAHGEAVPAVAEAVAGGSVTVRLGRPARGIAPGQAVVLYGGTRVIGSATIATTERAAAAIRS